MTLLNISWNYPYLWIFWSCRSVYTEENILTLAVYEPNSMANGCHNVWSMYNVPALTSISLNLNYWTMEQKEARLLHKVYQVYEGFSSLREYGIANEIPPSMFRLQSITLLIVAKYVRRVSYNQFLLLSGVWVLGVKSYEMLCCYISNFTGFRFAFFTRDEQKLQSYQLSNPLKK